MGRLKWGIGRGRRTWLVDGGDVWLRFEVDKNHKWGAAPERTFLRRFGFVSVTIHLDTDRPPINIPTPIVQ
jgi:hypothetical protein